MPPTPAMIRRRWNHLEDYRAEIHLPAQAPWGCATQPVAVFRGRNLAGPA